MKKSMLLSGGILLALMLTFFTGCKKDLDVMEPSPSPVQTTTMGNLQVSPNFDWKTMKNLQVDIKSNTKAVVYIKSKTGTIYHKAMVNYGENYSTIIPVPTYEKELEILLAGQSRTVQVSGDWISVTF